MLMFYDKKYGILQEHLYAIVRSLNYFTDAELDDNPKMLIPVSWKEVKKFFQSQAIKIAKNQLKI